MNEMYKKLSKHKDFGEFIIDKNKDLDYISTNVLVLNLLFGGDIRNGIQRGAINMISSPSAAGKSFIGLSVLKEAQKKNMECFVIDSEKAFDFHWAEKLGIDVDKVNVIKTSQIIKIKQFLSFITDGRSLEERQNIFILFDSWGPLVSQVMIDKSISASDTRDMSLPFWKNELANIMRETDCTYFVINHVYDNTGGFGEPLAVPGGRRLYFNSDNVVMGQSKARDKDSGGEISGAIITAFTHKGRKAKERSKLKFRIKHEGGLDPWYGLLPDALEHGCVVKPSNGFFSRSFIEEDKKFREKDIYNSEFWVPIFRDTDFENFLKEKYTYSGEIEVGKTDLNELLNFE